MAGKRKNASDLPPRTYLKRGVYYYVSKETGAWFSLGRDKGEAITRAVALYDGTARDPSAGLDLSGLRELLPIEISRTVRTALSITTSAKCGAIDRGIPFEITTQDILDLLAKAKGRCMATGIELSDIRDPETRITLWKPSLDRIDSRLGYAVGNIRIVCAAFNISVHDFGDGVFRKLAIGFLNLSKMDDATP